MAGVTAGSGAATPDQYGIVGHPIGHSWSPFIHGIFAKQTLQNLVYRLFDVEPADFDKRIMLLISGGVRGLNVTVPHKQAAARMAEEKTARALRARAVNTLVLREDGSLLGDNTDGAGLINDLEKNLRIELRGKRVLLLGAGDMAEAAARSLSKGARAVRICNRSFDRAVALAGVMQASAARWDELEQELVVADVVVASTASRTPVVTRDMVKRAMKARKGRTLFFVDIAVPRNVEPSVHGIDNVYVFNVDDLEKEVARGLEARHGEAAAAEKIVDDEVKQFLAWTRGLEVQPTVVAMRTKARAVLLGELERTLAGRLKQYR